MITKLWYNIRMTIDGFQGGHVLFASTYTAKQLKTIYYSLSISHKTTLFLFGVIVGAVCFLAVSWQIGGNQYCMQLLTDIVCQRVMIYRLWLTVWIIWQARLMVWLHKMFLSSQVSQIFKGYFTTYSTNTGHVCTCLNAFCTLIPNIITKFQNIYICYQIC